MSAGVAAAALAAARRRASESARSGAAAGRTGVPPGVAPAGPPAAARPAVDPPAPATGIAASPGANGSAEPARFAEVTAAPRVPERTESAADADRPPLPTRTPQAQAPVPADEPLPYEPPVFDVDDIAPLADLARASWGTTSVVDAPVAPHALEVSPPVEPAVLPDPAGPPASSGLNGSVRPAPPGAALVGPTAAPITDAPPAVAPPPGDPRQGPDGGSANRRWAMVGGAAVAALAVLGAVAVAAGGGDDDDPAAVSTTSPTVASTTTTTAPATPQAVFQRAGTALTDAGSFAYSGTVRALDVGALRPSVWLGTDVVVTGEVDLRAGRLHEVAVNPDGEATETVIDGGTVWGRTASSVEELADAGYSEISEFAHETPTPQGAQLLPAWLTQAAGPVPAPAAPRQPSYAATLTAATLGDPTGASPDSIVTVTVGPDGVPTHVDVMAIDAGQLALAYEITQVGTIAPIASPGDQAAATATTPAPPATTATTSPSTTAAPPSSPTTDVDR